jgi:6-phosphogluconolactonase
MGFGPVYNTAMTCRFARPLLAMLLAVLFGAPARTQPSGSAAGRAVLYASAGAELTQYTIDVESATLTRGMSIRLPANVQYAWPHPSRKFLYVVWSNGGASAAAPGAAAVPRGSIHGLGAFRIDPRSGALEAMGETVSLPARPIHVSVDRAGTHVLTAFNDPSGLLVHRLNAYGTIGPAVAQPAALDTGIYAHQIRVAPSNRTAILVTRGNAPANGKPEDRGAIKVFGYADGILRNLASIAPGGGVNFQPRHLDFHPTQPWVFVSLERQDKLQVYKITADGSLSADPVFTRDSLADPGRATLRQNAGTVHVHPNGRFVYQANRSTIPGAGGAGAGDGENSIAVYSIQPQTGQPTLIQSVDTRGAEPRTFALDPQGRILVAANQTAVTLGSGDGAKKIPASLAMFRVGPDGKLAFARKYDVDTVQGSMFWMGIVPLP